MKSKKFISEKEQTFFLSSDQGYSAETLVKVKGYCYSISTLQNSLGFVVSFAQQVRESSHNGRACVSYSLFDETRRIDLLHEKIAVANREVIKNMHTKALCLFDEKIDSLPHKDQEYKIEPGQVLVSFGYAMCDKGKSVIYNVDQEQFFYVGVDSLEFGQGDLHRLKSVNDKFGIGVYYVPDEKLSADLVCNILIDANQKKEEDERLKPILLQRQKEEKDRQKAEILAQYPFLRPCKDPHSGAKIVASQIRLELKKLFPEVKFSVVKESYDSVLVSWVDGVSQSVVGNVVSKYKDHARDITGDSLDYSPSVFNEVFGGCKFVFCLRTISQDVSGVVYDFFGKLGWDNYRVERFLSENDIPKGEFMLELSQEGGKYVFVDNSKCAAADASKKDVAGAACVYHNVERNGIEVSFEEKPDGHVVLQLKSLGFRWSQRQGKWYAKYSVFLLKVVKLLLK